jgi:uncharacterized membrane-anchored protein
MPNNRERIAELLAVWSDEGISRSIPEWQRTADPWRARRLHTRSSNSMKSAHFAVLLWIMVTIGVCVLCFVTPSTVVMLGMGVAVLIGTIIATIRALLNR